MIRYKRRRMDFGLLDGLNPTVQADPGLGQNSGRCSVKGRQKQAVTLNFYLLTELVPVKS